MTIKLDGITHSLISGLFLLESGKRKISHPAFEEGDILILKDKRNLVME